MARLPRLIIAGEVHYVGLRGRGPAPVLAAEADRDLWRDLAMPRMREASIALHAYCLLPDAVHLLLTPPEVDRLSPLMQAIGRVFGPRYNRRHDTSGSPWEGRFRAAPLQADPWLPPLMQYLDRLPVRDGLADRPEGYRWSSAAHYAGTATESGLTPPESIWLLGNTPFEREVRYRAGLQAEPAAEVRDALQRRLARGWPLGSPAWLDRIRADRGRPLEPRRAGRPRQRVGRE